MDDDVAFLPRLATAMEARGYEVKQAPDVATGLRLVEQDPPAYAVVDLRLMDGTGLQVISRLRELRPASRSIVLTGYGNIATAVGAVKAGADDYLAKPADADEIDLVLRNVAGDPVELPQNLMSVDQVRWEHIQNVFHAYEGNISETARRLNMHRRTLQRILAKGPREAQPPIDTQGHR